MKKSKLILSLMAGAVCLGALAPLQADAQTTAQITSMQVTSGGFVKYEDGMNITRSTRDSTCYMTILNDGDKETESTIKSMLPTQAYMSVFYYPDGITSMAFAGIFGIKEWECTSTYPTEGANSGTYVFKVKSFRDTTINSKTYTVEDPGNYVYPVTVRWTDGKDTACISSSTVSYSNFETKSGFTGSGKTCNLTFIDGKTRTIEDVESLLPGWVKLDLKYKNTNSYIGTSSVTDTVSISDWQCTSYPTGGTNSGSYVFTPVLDYAEIGGKEYTVIDTLNKMPTVTVHYVDNPLYIQGNSTFSIKGYSYSDDVYLAEIALSQTTGTSTSIYKNFTASLRRSSSSVLSQASIYGASSIEWTCTTSDSTTVSIYKGPQNNGSFRTSQSIQILAKKLTQSDPVTITVTAKITFTDGTTKDFTKKLAVTVATDVKYNLYLTLYPPAGKTCADVRSKLIADYGMKADYLGIDADAGCVYMYYYDISYTTIYYFSQQFGSTHVGTHISLTDFLSYVNGWYIASTVFSTDTTTMLTDHDVAMFGYSIAYGDGFFYIYLANMPGESAGETSERVTVPVTYMNDGVIIETTNYEFNKNQLIDLSDSTYFHYTSAYQPTWYLAETDSAGNVVKGAEILVGQRIRATDTLALVAETKIKQRYYFRVITVPYRVHADIINLNDIALTRDGYYILDNTDEIYEGATSEIYEVTLEDYIAIYAKSSSVLLIDFLRSKGMADVDNIISSEASHAVHNYGYLPTGTTSGNTFATFVISLAKQMDFTVKKQWWPKKNDYNRPDSVLVQLNRHDLVNTDDEPVGETVVLNEANDWTYTWKAIPDDYTYTVREVAVSDSFTVVYYTEGNMTTITNIRMPDPGNEEAYRAVYLSEAPGVVTDPAAGIHYVAGHKNFTFTATYTTGEPQKVFAVGYYSKKTLELEPEDMGEGVYKYVLRQVTEPWTITFGTAADSGATGTEAVAETKVWSHGSTLYVSAPAETQANIYAVTGSLVKTLQLPAGETRETLERGIYIVKIGSKTSKIVIR